MLREPGSAIRCSRQLSESLPCKKYRVQNGYRFTEPTRNPLKTKWKTLEARVGFEPTNGGFADLSLGPLGYRAELLSIANLPELSGQPLETLLPEKLYFFSATDEILASRKNRADSSGGVGLI